MMRTHQDEWASNAGPNGGVNIDRVREGMFPLYLWNKLRYSCCIHPLIAFVLDHAICIALSCLAKNQANALHWNLLVFELGADSESLESQP